MDVARERDLHSLNDWTSGTKRFKKLTPYNPSRQRRIIRALATGLNELHSRGVVISRPLRGVGETTELTYADLESVASKFIEVYDSADSTRMAWQEFLRFLRHVLRTRDADLRVIREVLADPPDIITEATKQRAGRGAEQERRPFWPDELHAIRAQNRKAVLVSPNPLMAEQMENAFECMLSGALRPGDLIALTVGSYQPLEGLSDPSVAGVVTVPDLRGVLRVAEEHNAPMSPDAKPKRREKVIVINSTFAPAWERQQALRRRMGARDSDPLWVLFDEEVNGNTIIPTKPRAMTYPALARWCERTYRPRGENTGKQRPFHWMEARGYVDFHWCLYWCRYTALTYTLVFTGNKDWVSKELADHADGHTLEDYVRDSDKVRKRLTKQQREELRPQFLHLDATPGLLEERQQATAEIAAAKAESERREAEIIELKAQNVALTNKVDDLTTQNADLLRKVRACFGNEHQAVAKRLSMM
jgi:chorismate mutase